ncbi:hypothetical protein PR002_g28481 [Phytophthora rubi]|uniref:Uncharacterized protein n=1 Tax=Phytophthora rubi TaxID=129364 RepID=A0A6A3HB37_9STRA|nr:hypothetical protein PR002_g28481 [Phytophthora rubi]
MDGYRTRLVPTRKTPTPEKTFCATAPPSSIAHLVGRIHRHGDVHTGQEVQERSAGAETYMQPSAGRRIPGQAAAVLHAAHRHADGPTSKLANASPMDLLFAIQDDVLKQKEQEAVNYFSHVQELREFIMTARPARDVVATPKGARAA